MSDGSYMPTNSNSRSQEMVYDPVTKKWNKTTSNSTNANGANITTSSTKSEPAPKPSTGSSVNGISSKPTKSNTQKKADKEYIEKEYNTLEGNIEVTPSDITMSLLVDNTVQVEGLGSNLSGPFYIDTIDLNIDSSSGITITLGVMRTGFGDKMKVPKPANEERKTEVSKEVSKFNVGDKVSIQGDNAVYANASDGVPVPNWVKSMKLTVSKVSSDGSRVLLKEINSWTYTKYVKKV